MKNTTLDLKQAVNALCFSKERAVLLMRLIDKVDDRLSKAPASSAVRYHHAYEGGLVDHITEVYNLSLALANGIGFDGAQSIITVAILHDLSKIGDGDGNPQYVPNILKSGKVSDAIPYEKDKEECRRFNTFTNQEAASLLGFAEFSDGEASLALLAALAPDLLADLTESEVNAIRFHDAGYGKAKYATGYQGKEDQLAIIVHAADMLSSRSRNWETPTPTPAT